MIKKNNENLEYNEFGQKSKFNTFFFDYTISIYNSLPARTMSNGYYVLKNRVYPQVFKISDVEIHINDHQIYFEKDYKYVF